MRKLVLLLVTFLLTTGLYKAQTGSALNFDGVDDYVTRPVFNTNTSNVTLGARVNLTASTSTNQVIVYNGSTSSNGYGMMLGIGNTSVTLLYGGSVGHNTGYTLTPGQWTSLTMVVVNSTQVILYVNGTQQFSVNPTLLPTTPAGDFRIGGNHLGTETFNGMIEDVRFWNRALCASEIAYRSNCQPVGNEADLQAYYNFNQGIDAGANTAVTTLTDVTASAFNATLTNFALTTGTVSNWINPVGTLSTTCGAAPANATISAASMTICNGTALTLSVTGVSTASWSTGTNGTLAISVTPSTTTTYSVLGTTTAGCYAMGSNTVVVNPTPSITASSSSICAGQQVTLTALPASSTYSWIPLGVTGQTATGAPSGNTTYTLISPQGSTCQALFTVTVTAIPVLTITASPTLICQGGSSTLTATGATSYTWSSAASGNTAVVSPTITTIFTATGTTNGCTATKTINIPVNTTVSIAATNTLLCSGNPATLTASGASTYTWLTTPVVNTTSITVTPSVNTNYTVNATTTVAAGSCTSSAVISISVNATPTVNVSSSPSVICGTTTPVTATITATGANTYSWNPSATGPTVTNVNPTASTNYTVTGTTNGCSNIKTFTLVVAPIPTITVANTTMCVGQTKTLTATGAGTGGTYTWVAGPTSSLYAVSPATTTTYSVSGTSSVGCTSTVTATTVTVSPNPTVGFSQSTSSLCSTTTMIVTGNNANTYTWVGVHATTGATGTIPNGTAFTPTLLPTITTSGTVNYTLTGTSSVGCTHTAIATVTVIVTPNAGISAAPQSFCEGVVSTLSVSAPSQTWSPASPGMTNTPSMTISPVAGTYTYSVSKTNNGLCLHTSTILITVNALPPASIYANPTVVCSGTPLQLTGGGGSTSSSYTWSVPLPSVISPTATNPTTLIPSTPGPGSSTVIVTVTVTNGLCLKSTTMAIQVDPQPTITIVGTPTAICRNDATTLTASGASATTSYSWLPGTTTGTNAIIVNPLTATAYTAIGQNSFGCTASKIQAINVYTLPVITATLPTTTGNNTLTCVGGQATVTSTGCSTCTYSWSTGAGGTLAVVQPVGTTVYTVTATNTVNQCKSQRTLTLSTFDPTVTITGSYSTCVGGAISLTANVFPAPQITIPSPYLWNGNYQFQVFSPVTQPTVATPYFVTVKTQSNNVTCSGLASMTMQIYQNPTITAVSEPSLICKGDQSAVTGTGGVSYVWSENNQAAQTISVSPTAAVTVYTVTGTDANGCSGTATVNVKTSTCPGMEELSGINALLSIYPNPNNGEFTVKGEETMSLRLMNELGQLVKEVKLDASNDYRSTIANLPNGVYFMVSNKGSQKIIVNK